MQDKHCLTCLELEKCTFYVRDLGPKPSEVQLSTYSCYKYNPKQTEIKLESLTVMNLKPDDILVFKVDARKIEDLDDVLKYLDEKLKVDNKIFVMRQGDDISAIRTKKAAG